MGKWNQVEKEPVKSKIPPAKPRGVQLWVYYREPLRGAWIKARDLKHLSSQQNPMVYSSGYTIGNPSEEPGSKPET